MSTSLNLGGNLPPRLRPQHTLWSLGKLPMNSETEWTLDEKFERVAAAGFEAVECWLSDDNEREVKDALDRHGLALALGHRPFTPEDTRITIDRALRLGAQYVMGQPADAFTPLGNVVELVREGMRMASDAGIPIFYETHRGNFTETIPQTIALVERVPEIRITADLSHFVVVGEFYGWESENAAERMRPILERVHCIHGRVSNGEQVQVDCGDGSTPWARFFVELWTEAMRHWRRHAGPGDILPFSTELGPPRYAITTPDGKEISDRWTQSLLMRDLANEAWERSGAGS
jgi:sugar phosphate isomerase/epimerase